MHRRKREGPKALAAAAGRQRAAGSGGSPKAQQPEDYPSDDSSDVSDPEMRVRREREKRREQVQKKKEEKEEDTSKSSFNQTALLIHIMIGLVFISLPHSTGDMKCMYLAAGVNLLGIYFLSTGGFMDSATFVLLNLVIVLHGPIITTEYHKVPGLMEPEQWAVFLGLNGIAGLLAWFKFIKGLEDDDERDRRWTYIFLLILAANVGVGMALGIVELRHVMMVFSRLRSLLVSGDIGG